MKRKFSALISALLCLILISSTSVNAATKAGAKCTKVGITTVVGNKTFTCIKLGKKRIWNNGVENKNSSEEIIAKALPPTSFDNLFERRNAIPYTAWKSTAESIKNGSSTIKNFSVFLGPKSTAPKYKTPKIAYGLVSQAFYKYKTPENIVVIQYSKSDISWAENKVKEFVTESEYNELNRNENGKLISSNCQENDCYGAKQVSVRGKNGTAFVLQGVAYQSNNDPLAVARWELGQLDAHEFFHALQRTNIEEIQITEWPTSWINEGGASLAQNLVMSHESYSEYMKWRKLDSRDLYGRNTTITTKFMESFLDLKNNKDYWRSVDNYYAYNLGSRIMEIFVALKGPGVLLDIHKETALNGFDAAFESIFGLPWSKASLIVTSTIVESFQTGE